MEGLESANWRSLWIAASTFSRNNAYKGAEFPNVCHEALCVLCQQKIDSVAADRLSKFEEFIQGEAQKAAEKTKAEFDEAVRVALGSFAKQQIVDAISDLDIETPEAANQARLFLDEVARCQSEIQQNLDQPKPVLAQIPIESIVAAIEKVNLLALEFEKTADPASREKSELRYAALFSKSQLSQILPQVLAEISRLSRLNALSRCSQDTDTRST